MNLYLVPSWFRSLTRLTAKVQPVLENVTLHNVMASFSAVVTGLGAALAMHVGVSLAFFVTGEAGLGTERANRIDMLTVTRYGVSCEGA